MGKMLKVLFALVLMLAVAPNISFAAQSANFDADLDTYLKEISTTRGFPVTKEDIEMSLSNYGEEIANFDTIDGEEGLKTFLGEVIKADYSNLDYMVDDYDLTIDDLKTLLQENGEEIDDYVFVDDLDQAVSFYLNPDDGGLGGDIDEEFINELLTMFQDELGLTEQELTNLGNHFEGLNDQLSTPEAMEKLDQLAQRMEAFAQFDTLDELTPEQVQEFLSIYDELFSMLELKVDFFLVQGNKETALSLLDLLKMKDLVNAKLKANFYDLDGNLLADLIVTGEMVDSDTVKNIGKDIGKATDKVKEVTKQQPVQKTVKGGKLPNTSGNYVMNILIGLIMASGGVILYRLRRKDA